MMYRRNEGLHDAGGFRTTLSQVIDEFNANRGIMENQFTCLSSLQGD